MSEIIENLAKTVEGSNKNRDVTILTLSTCMWCKKCKAWLKDRDVKYKYVDVDMVIFRENTEDVYSGLEQDIAPGIAQCLKIITRDASEKMPSLPLSLPKKTTSSKDIINRIEVLIILQH